MRRLAVLLWLAAACSDRSKAPPPAPRPAPTAPTAVVDASPPDASIDASVDAAPWMLGERPLPASAGNEKPVMCQDPGPCRAACDSGDGAGCYWLGIMYITKADVSFGVPYDPVKGNDLLLQSCDHGITLGCNGAAQNLRMGNLDGVPQDPARAQRLFDKACGLGMKAACHNAKGMRGQ